MFRYSSTRLKANTSILLSNENIIKLDDANAQFPLWCCIKQEDWRGVNIGAEIMQSFFTPLIDHH